MSDSEIKAIVDELEQLMDALRGNVGALEAIIAGPTEPEVRVDKPERA